MRYKRLKSDGQWFRMQQRLKKLTSDERSTLIGQLQADEEVSTMADSYVSILVGVGYDSGIDGQTLISDWITNGIPREVWFGYSRYAHYSLVEGKGYYKADYSDQMRAGGNSLRGIVSIYLLARGMAKDLVNAQTALQGNPGGKADADAATR